MNVFLSPNIFRAHSNYPPSTFNVHPNYPPNYPPGLTRNRFSIPQKVIPTHSVSSIVNPTTRQQQSQPIIRPTLSTPTNCTALGQHTHPMSKQVWLPLSRQRFHHSQQVNRLMLLSLDTFTKDLRCLSNKATNI